MSKEIIRTSKAPAPPPSYSQAKLPIRPKGMKISVAVIAEA